MTEINKMEAHEVVDRVLGEALSLKASDVYWIPQRESYSVRVKVNGVQSERYRLPPETGRQATARIKVLSQLLTYRNQVSQDGVIKDDKLYPDAEFRIAVMPTIHGERVTVRVLDKKNSPLFLEELNFAEDVILRLKKLLLCPSGLIVLTGPTGCGKTTTIYAMVRELLRDNQDPASIISVEDPVECQLDGISQVSLSKASEEWNYAKALRASLRQDIKTLIVGEMRDHEVIKVALDAALTGHRVITTFHAGDIPSVYTRILHHGFEPFLVASAITGILSQRLCSSTSQAKRIPLVAMLTPDDEWRDFVISKPGLIELRKKAKQIPCADIVSVAQEMAEKGLIDQKEVFLL